MTVITKEITDIAKKAKEASRALAALDTASKNMALHLMADALDKKRGDILEANKIDVQKAREKALSPAMIDRLALTGKRIDSMCRGMRDVAALKDEVGEIFEMRERPNGLWIGKVRVPIGVIGIIYEARPNVTSDCAALTLKSGNSVILKGGSEALNSNIAIFDALRHSMKAAGLPEHAISLIKTPDRAAVDALLRLNDYVDLIMPRGGEGLIKEVTGKSTIPVIKHYKGVCHVYVDEHADLNMAHSIALNAKLQRPGVCNAMETLLVHEAEAHRFLPVLAKEMRDGGVEIRGCQKTKRIIKDVKLADEADWSTEYLDLILSVRVVVSVDEAIAHITRYGSSHSDAIVTDNFDHALKFLKTVDSACVYLNASTRFTDGGEFGMGAEIGISTDKLHARGPMGLRELTTYKYVIFGNGQVRS